MAEPDPILDDAAYIRTLLFRLERAALTPETVSEDERCSVCREAKLVIIGLKERGLHGR